MAEHKVVLDTDIGDTIDDAFTLALLLSSPELKCRAVITTYADAHLRCDLAEAMLATRGMHGCAVPGCADPITPRPASNGVVFTYTSTPDGRVAKRQPSPEAERPGVKAMLDINYDSLVCIGPLTNLAVCLDTGLPAGWRPRIVAMCGEFDQPDYIEHNVCCDPDAAHRVFCSNLPMDIIPGSIGPKVALSEDEIARLRRAAEGGDALLRLLVAWLDEFWEHFPGKTTMPDPMTLVALLHPEWFTWQQGRVSVARGACDELGLTRFTADNNGPHRVAVDVDAEKAKSFLLDRLCDSPAS